jgi:phosphoglucomutase/phosphomannomutase
LGGIAVKGLRDYKQNQWIPVGGTPEPLAGPTGDLVIFDLAETGNYVAARPSGTEPKVKFYMFTYIPPEQLASLEFAREESNQRLDQFEADLEKFAAEV